MALIIQKAGLATSIQDKGRCGFRHLGVPTSGAADILSLALANYLVGREPDSAGLEFTLIGGRIVFTTRVTFALTGALAHCRLNGTPIPHYEQITSQSNNVLEIPFISQGCRLYMAISGELEAENIFNSFSTYVAGGFGGFRGRNLVDGDVLPIHASEKLPKKYELEKQYRPFISNHVVVRAVTGSEINLLVNDSQSKLFSEQFIVSNRTNRMGIEIKSPVLEIQEGGSMKSSAVFPGLVQCPPSGKAFVLLADAQTTGGYPRIAQVIRADRHLLGQLKSGSTLRFIQCSHKEAAIIIREKNSLYAKLFGKDIF